MRKTAPTPVPDAAMVDLIAKIARAHRDAAQRYKLAGQADRARDELARAEIIASYLPATARDTPRKPPVTGG